jgi:acetyltransferase-like isoleucine patch superfamily enzyme
MTGSPSLAWRLQYRWGPERMSDLRRLVVTRTHRHATVQFRGPARLGPGFTLDLPGTGSFVVGAGVDFRRGFVCEISGDGRVEIGDGSIFTRDALVQCSTSIVIGRRCVFGQSVQLADGNHRYTDPDRHLLDQGYDFRPLVVGDGAVVMSKCTVLASLGERSIVAAHSVVTRPVAPFTLVGGTPARQLRDLRAPSPS